MNDFTLLVEAAILGKRLETNPQDYEMFYS